MYGQAYAWIITASGFRIFQYFWKSGLGLSIYVKNGSKISLDCPFKDFLYYYLLAIVQ